MIKLNKLGQSAICSTSPYFSHICLTQAYVKSIKWQGNQGVMIADKSHWNVKLFLSNTTYQGKGDLRKKIARYRHHTIRYITATLSRVGNKDFKIGYIYNLTNIHN